MASASENGSARVHRTPLERLQLARRIDAARDRNVSWDRIAEDEGIPKRTAQDIRRKFIAQVEALSDPQVALIETVQLSTAAIDVLCWEMEHGDNSSARVGAARALLKAQHERLNLLANIGLLPANVGARRQYREMRTFLERLVEVFSRNLDDIPQPVMHQIEQIVNDLPEDGIEDVTPPWSMNRPKERPW